MLIRIPAQEAQDGYLRNGMELRLSGVFSLPESRGLSRVPIMLMSETVIFIKAESRRGGGKMRCHTDTGPPPTLILCQRC